MIKKTDKPKSAPDKPVSAIQPTVYVYDVGVKNRAVFQITANKVVVNNGILILMLDDRQVFVAAPQKWEFVQTVRPAGPVLEATPLPLP